MAFLIFANRINLLKETGFESSCHVITKNNVIIVPIGKKMERFLDGKFIEIFFFFLFYPTLFFSTVKIPQLLIFRFNFSTTKFRIETNDSRKNDTDTPIHLLCKMIYIYTFIHERRQFYYFQIYLRFKNIWSEIWIGRREIYCSTIYYAGSRNTRNAVKGLIKRIVSSHREMHAPSRGFIVE